jgi:hypothetical protein
VEAVEPQWQCCRIHLEHLEGIKNHAPGGCTDRCCTVGGIFDLLSEGFDSSADLATQRTAATKWLQSLSEAQLLMLLRFARKSSGYYSAPFPKLQANASQPVCTDPAQFKVVPDFMQPMQPGGSSSTAKPSESTVVELEWREGRDADQWQAAIGAVYHAVSAASEGSESASQARPPLKMKLCYIAVQLLMTLRNVVLSGYAARTHPWKFPTSFTGEARTTMLKAYTESDVFLQFACRFGLFVTALDMLDVSSPGTEGNEELKKAKSEAEAVLRDDAKRLTEEGSKKWELTSNRKAAVIALFRDVVEGSSDEKHMEASGYVRLHTELPNASVPLAACPQCQSNLGLELVARVGKADHPESGWKANIKGALDVYAVHSPQPLLLFEELVTAVTCRLEILHGAVDVVAAYPHNYYTTDEELMQRRQEAQGKDRCKCACILDSRVPSTAL